MIGGETGGKCNPRGYEARGESGCCLSDGDNREDRPGPVGHVGSGKGERVRERGDRKDARRSSIVTLESVSAHR